MHTDFKSAVKLKQIKFFQICRIFVNKVHINKIKNLRIRYVSTFFNIFATMSSDKMKLSI